MSSNLVRLSLFRCMMTDNYDPVGAVARCATELNIDSKGKMQNLKIEM